MLDIGWSELLLIGIVALIVVGPKELPGLFRTAGQFMGRARGMAREFQRSLEAAANESGLSEASKSLKALDRLNLNSATASARKYAGSVVSEARSAVDEARAAGGEPNVAKPTVSAPAVATPLAEAGPAASTPESPPGAAAP